MTFFVLPIMAVLFATFAAFLTAIESALGYFPRHDAETIAEQSRGESLAHILASPAEHLNALRFWRVWFEMASAVAAALWLMGVLENEWIAGLIATVIMAAIGFVLVGLSPRRVGRFYAAALVGRTAGLVHFLTTILGPMPGLFVRMGGALSVAGHSADESFVSEEEFREFVDRASDSDMIEDAEAEIIHSVIDMGETMVRAVMVPRTDIRSIEHDATLEEALDVFLDSGFSRIPVIGESTDHILGILYLKDLVSVIHRLGTENRSHRLEDLARNVRYVPESKAVDALLRELQLESTHLAIVIDEYGGTAGLVTLEDLIEEIVGEIADEYDRVSSDYEEVESGLFRVQSRMSVDDFGALFGLEMDDDEVDSVGGLLAKHLGRVPAEGDRVEVNGITLVAERMEPARNRVSHILAWKNSQSTQAAASELAQTNSIDRTANTTLDLHPGSTVSQSRSSS